MIFEQFKPSMKEKIMRLNVDVYEEVEVDFGLMLDEVKVTKN